MRELYFGHFPTPTHTLDSGLTEIIVGETIEIAPILQRRMGGLEAPLYSAGKQNSTSWP